MRTWIVLVVVAVALGATPRPFKPTPKDRTTLLVRCNLPSPEVDAFHKKHRVKVIRYRHVPWEAVELKTKDAEAIYRAYEGSGLFEKVHYANLYSVERTPNDPLFAQQWDMLKIAAPLAWDLVTTNDVVVAVIDTGIDYTHPDLRDNLWTGPGGEHGYSAFAGTISPGGQENHYHGTHVAGTIGAVGNNSRGVAGINWRVKLLSLAFIGSGGSGSSADAGLCIEKMIDLRKSGVNLRVSNNSWGGFGYDPFLEDLFFEASLAGILNVCAAGNNNLDTDDLPFTPATLEVESIVSVLASDQNDGKAYFSNFGATTTDLLAPGVAILSCQPAERYQLLSGTSMASPHVAGAAAMLFALNPNLDPLQAKTILLQPASYDTTSFTVNTTGGGRLNLHKLWSNPSIYSPPPRNNSPILAVATNQFFVGIGQTVPVAVTASDADGDPLDYHATWDTWRLPWFLRYMSGGVVQFSGATNSNVLRITGKDLAFDQAVKARFTVTDGRGGGDVERVSAFTFRNEARVFELEKAVTGLRIWDVDGHPWFRLEVDPAYPAFDSVKFDLQVYGGEAGGGGVGSPCCHPPNTDIRALYDGFAKGSYSIRAHVSDQWGNFATSPQATYYVSNSTLRPPTVRLNVNTQRGVAPLKVRVDMSATLPGGTSRLLYQHWLLDTSAFTTDLLNPIREFTLVEPGVYAMQFNASDFGTPPKPLADTVVKTFTVLPMPAQQQPVQLLLVPWGEYFGLTVYSAVGAVVQLQQSTDLRTWATFRTITNVSGADLVPVTTNSVRRFIRALR